ncbi:MAG: hypothetical protein CVU84_14095 [Firmicutes bacterium HGW-Firmicutes-1]|nr:MAG: hypothetical protein CVU84_14095 [Firmicutes bacterium HGW-Firmicutes-1]
MKKIIPLTLVVSGIMLTFVIAANAGTNTNVETNTKEETLTFTEAPITVRTAHAVMATKGNAPEIPNEISGTIEKINKYDMTVKTKDQEYLVPIGHFLENEEFKKLDLKVGTEVTLKMSQEIGISTGGSTAVIFEASTEAVPAIMRTTLDTDSVEVKTGVEQVDIILENNERIISGLPAANSISIIKALPATNNESSTASVPYELGTYFVNVDDRLEDGEVVKDAMLIELSEGTLVFIADEITANGKTIKLTQ